MLTEHSSLSVSYQNVCCNHFYIHDNPTVHCVCVAVSADARPTEAERELWEQVNKVLMEAMSVLEDLQSYSGAGEAIRQVSL